MSWLVIATALTLSLSFLCSLLEAIVLSTTSADIQGLRRRHPRRGELLELIKGRMDDTISAILTLNTIANTLGSMIIGGIAAHHFGDLGLGILTASLTIGVLVFAEVLPKSLGVAYRRSLLPHVVYPLWWIRRVLRPVAYVCRLIVRPFVPQRHVPQASEEEILLLAERGAEEGTLTKSESSIITNALALDDVRVSEIMTPRTVVTALSKAATVGDVFREFPNLPFGRMPVYGRNLDDIVGLARRRDLLKAKANDQDGATVESVMQEIHFIPQTVTVANALQVFLKTHQQLLVVVDEFGSTAGVVTMEDAMELLLGREIFEKDDVAVDMRELARAKQQKTTRYRRPSEASAAPFTAKS
ncbi:MAG: HlyC/CorC family transporter [Verrucomicrobia bacterium]|nr:HlyC/CorC family transporter [Verrucomicrobiota bacterium]